MNYFTRLIAASVSILCLANTNSHAQNTIGNQVKPAQIIPPAPNAASLGKYGGVELGLSSGTPNIRIPLLDYRSIHIGMPISLSYSSTGWKIDDLPGRIGFGWRLNAGGVINRTVRGSIDETTVRQIPSPIPGGRTMADLLDMWTGQGDATGAVGPYSWRDDQPDIFNFNVNNYSGSFILDSARTINGVTSMQPILLNHSGIKIFRSPNADGYMFKIITPDGVQYLFNSADNTRTYNASTSDANCEYVFDANVPTSWYLDRVIHPNHDTVDLTYTTLTYHYTTGISETKNQIDGHNMTQECNGNPVSAPVWPLTKSCSSIFETTGPVLDQINSKAGGKVKFLYSTPAAGDDKYVTSIEVYQPGQASAYKFFDLAYETGRLFLHSVTERGPDNSLKKTHSFVYNDNGSLPPRLSYSRDHWGYYNGKSNSTLIPPSTDEEMKYYIPSATANRNADPAYAQKGVLNSITYPTGGKDSIFYEGNIASVRQTTNPAPATISLTGSSSGGSFSYSSVPVIISYPQSVTISGFRSANDQQDSAMSTNVISIWIGSQNYGSVDLSTPYTYSGSKIIFLREGTYTLKMDISGNNASAGASIDYHPGLQTWGDVNMYVGGVRVSKVLTYDNASAAPQVKKYSYSIGNLTFSPTYEKRTKAYVVCPELSQGTYCHDVKKFDYWTMYSNSVNDLNSFNAPISYETVTESFGENYENGGIEHHFTVVANDAPAVLYGDPILGAPGTDKSYLNGLETNTYTFKKINGATIPVKQVFTHYLQDTRKAAQYNAFVANRKYIWGCGVTGEPVQPEWDQFDCSAYRLIKSWVYPDTVRTRIYNDDGSRFIERTAVTEYANPDHALPTKVTSYESDGTATIQQNAYPPDLTLTGYEETARQALINRGILVPVLQQTTMKAGVQTILVKNVFAIFNSGLVLPQSVWTQTQTNPIEKRLEYYKYNDFGKLVEQGKANDAKHSYIWDYNNLYPICEVTNADSSNIAYTSFEADGSGGWNIAGTFSDGTYSITGAKSHNLASGGASKSGLSTSSSYIVSYWSRTGLSYTVAGSTSVKQGKTINNWTYFEHMVTGSSTVNVTGSGYIDELRLYPSMAQMVTYTYQPLIGMTSSCDVQNKITYYYYDKFGMLASIKDQDGNVVKTIDYHYKN